MVSSSPVVASSDHEDILDNVSEPKSAAATPDPETP